MRNNIGNCTKCGGEVTNKGYLCSPCRREYRQRPDQKLAQWKQHIKYTYGITEDDFKKILKDQNFQCAICKKNFEDEKPRIDHDHVTKEIRGLLCDRCNVGLGAFKDSPVTLIAAAVYIQYAEKRPLISSRRKSGV